MAEKHVLFTFNHAPYGSIWYNEGLRAVVGVTSGIDEHTVDVVYVGDGVYFTLKGVERTDSAKYLGTLAKAGYKLKAERESLEARGIDPSELAEDVEVISRADVVALVDRADATIDF
ncbi:MAG: DsrH/TusB family sulfur metabolism protein [Dehalococcoidales bacterium]|nr:DsrH/TusB family sulfur metabolism protein [Dehalococcoidales bacterium]